MRPTQHTSNNDVLRPPRGASADECRPLPITRVLYQPSNMPAVVSYWQPTPEQLALLNAGRPVWLSVMGSTHPPMAIGVEGDGRLG